MKKWVERSRFVQRLITEVIPPTPWRCRPESSKTRGALRKLPQYSIEKFVPKWQEMLRTATPAIAVSPSRQPPLTPTPQSGKSAKTMAQ